MIDLFWLIGQAIFLVALVIVALVTWFIVWVLMRYLVGSQ